MIMLGRRRRNMPVSLTPLGKQKADDYEGEGPEFMVMNYLANYGVSTAGDISKGTGIPPMKVEAIVRSLTRKNLARYHESGDDV